MQLPCEFSVTSHVSEEISDHYPEQKQRFQSARDAGILAELIVDVPHELRLFTFFAASGRLGAGECSAITAAIGRGYDLAIDDARARREALAFHAELKVLGTKDLVVSAIKENLLTVAESDEIKSLWESEHRFKLKFNSFADLLE